MVILNKLVVVVVVVVVLKTYLRLTQPSLPIALSYARGLYKAWPA